MPSFHDHADSKAAPEEVWKLLYDPARFPEWWAGIGTIEAGEDGAYTMYPDGYPDFPMAQLLRSDRDSHRVTVSCMVSDLIFEWRLAPGEAEGTHIDVQVEIPDSEAARLDSQRELISTSLRNLARLASEREHPIGPVLETVPIRGEMIRLGQLLKLAELIDSGSEAKALLASGAVSVNEVLEVRRGRQLHAGDTVRVAERSLQIVCEA